MADETIITKSTSELIKARMNGEELEPLVRSAFQKTGDAALVPTDYDFGGKYKDTTRVFTNPNDSTEEYHEVMEPGNLGPGFLSAPLPFYSAAWQAIMNRFANELPPEVLAKIDAAYGEELAKAKAYENKLRQDLGSDFDEFDQMAVDSETDKARSNHEKALKDARKEQQDKSESEGKAKAEKILDKKAKKTEKFEVKGDDDVKEVSEGAESSENTDGNDRFDSEDADFS